jgi:XTP/dITP diphosphohydrolase
MDLLLATRNVNKTREFAQILGAEFQVSDLSNLENCAKVEETGRTFSENAMLKALAVSSLDQQLTDRHLLVVADDSGLEIDSLGGAPGIFSARYAGENATDEANINKLLRELSETRERSARFRCVIALARDGKLLGTFEGAVEGTIVDHPRGNRGFGYDPIFLPDRFDATFGELPAESKNEISHRARAIAALREALLTEKFGSAAEN